MATSLRNRLSQVQTLQPLGGQDGWAHFLHPFTGAYVLFVCLFLNNKDLFVTQTCLEFMESLLALFAESRIRG